MADNSTVPLQPPPDCAEHHECLVAWGYLNYLPSVPANAVFVALFTIGLVAQAVFGLRHRTWGFTTAMLVGTILEVVGYGGRIGLHYDVFIDTWFIMYLCCLTIAPAFFSAAVYLSLSRILAIYGEALSFLKGRTITITFIACDFISLVLQAVGGAIASTAATNETRNMGVNIMIAGLSSQVAATTAFSLLCLHIMWNVRKHPERVKLESEGFRRSKRLRVFNWGIALAITTILIRCSFRVAELSEGFKSEIANDEVLFIIFESVMMVICVSVLTVAHPGLTLGARWNKGQFHWSLKRIQELSPYLAYGTVSTVNKQRSVSAEVPVGIPAPFVTTQVVSGIQKSDSAPRDFRISIKGGRRSTSNVDSDDEAFWSINENAIQKDGTFPSVQTAVVLRLPRDGATVLAYICAAPQFKYHVRGSLQLLRQRRNDPIRFNGLTPKGEQENTGIDFADSSFNLSNAAEEPTEYENKMLLVS